MDTTTILPTPPTSGAIVQSSGNNGYDACVAELITNNNIADNSRAVLTAIANGNAAIIAADQAGHLVNQKTTGDASVANLKATYDAQVAGINQTNLGTVSTTKAVTDGSSLNLSSTERNSAEIRMNVAREAGETRLATAIANGEIRELISEKSTTNLIAIKDNGFAIREEGCKTRELVLIESHKTREKEAEHFAALQLQACKDTSAILLESERNKAALAAQIAKCCCENELLQKETQALILKQTTDRYKDEIEASRFKILALENKIPLVTVAA